MSIYHYVGRDREAREERQSLRERYTPKSAGGIYGREAETCTLVTWLRAFKAKERNRERFVMVSGPSGVGKTMLVTTAVTECGMHIMEMNQNSPKTRREIVDALSTCNHRCVAFFDEFDFMEGLTVADLKQLMESFPLVPFVFVVNKYTHGKTFDLSKDALHVCMDPLDGQAVQSWILSIMQREGMFAGQGAQAQLGIASKLTGMCNGDMRYALNWLELNHKQRYQGVVREADMRDISHKDEDINCIQATKLLMYDDAPMDVHAAINMVHYDINLITSMVSENYISAVNEHDASCCCMQKLSQCADVISFADLVETQIYSNQVWGMWDLYAFTGAVYPALTVRRKIAENPSFTKMWSVVSNMYYRIYRIEEVRMCLLKKSMSVDRDSLMGLGAKINNLIASGNISECMSDLVALGLTSDNINMLVKCGAMMSYKNTLQKKIKKEYDKILGRPAKATSTHGDRRAGGPARTRGPAAPQKRAGTRADCRRTSSCTSTPAFASSAPNGNVGDHGTSQTPDTRPPMAARRRRQQQHPPAPSIKEGSA